MMVPRPMSQRFRYPASYYPFGDKFTQGSDATAYRYDPGRDLFRAFNMMINSTTTTVNDLIKTTIRPSTDAVEQAEANITAADTFDIHLGNRIRQAEAQETSFYGKYSNRVTHMKSGAAEAMAHKLYWWELLNHTMQAGTRDEKIFNTRIEAYYNELNTYIADAATVIDDRVSTMNESTFDSLVQMEKAEKIYSDATLASTRTVTNRAYQMADWLKETVTALSKSASASALIGLERIRRQRYAFENSIRKSMGDESEEMLDILATDRRKSSDYFNLLFGNAMDDDLGTKSERLEEFIGNSVLERSKKTEDAFKVAQETSDDFIDDSKSTHNELVNMMDAVLAGADGFTDGVDQFVAKVQASGRSTMHSSEALNKVVLADADKD